MSSDPAEFAPFSTLDTQPDENDFAKQQQHIKDRLFRCLKAKTVVAFIGAGCSLDVGYPTWQKFGRELLKRVQDDLEKDLGSMDQSRSHDARKLESTLATIHSAQRYFEFGNPLPDHLTYRTILGKCESANSPAFRVAFQKLFTDIYNQATQENKRAGHTSLSRLIELPISRYITTNYDLEIEKALPINGKDLFGKDPGEWFDQPAGSEPEQMKLVRDTHFPLGTSKSFSQSGCCWKQSSIFSLALSEASHYMIFHCHGRMDDDGPASCVITEQNYKRWYLQEDEPARALQQTMNLLFGSNPLLVVGYELGDPELMHFLQLVNANRASDPNRSPLFVLLRIPSPAEPITTEVSRPLNVDDEGVLNDICDSLNARYGAYVIPFRDRDFTWAQQLEELRKGWDTWCLKIQAKPSPKTFNMTEDRKKMNPPQRSIASGDRYFHYGSPEGNSDRIETEGYTRLREQLRKLISEKGPQHYAVLTGDAGTGKTWSARRFAIEFLDGKWYEEFHFERKVYFWSSYYTNDLFTGIKRALKFFNRSPNLQPDRIMHEFAELLDRPILLIFDGVERLLHPTESLSPGKAVNQDVELFFEIIRNSKQAFVILTSRQMPLDLLTSKGSGEEKKSVALTTSSVHLPIESCKSTDLSGRSIAEWAVDLCSLLHGHIYCLSLIEKMLEADDDGKPLDKQKLMTELVRDVVNTPPDRRPERVIRKAIEQADVVFKGRRLVEKFLERVALFMNPVEADVLTVCLAESLGGGGKEKSPAELADATSAMILHLSRRKLLLAIWFNDTSSAGYVVHPLLQRYVRKHLHKSVFSSDPSMILPGHTSAFDVVDPGSRTVGKPVAKGLFEALCKKADGAGEKERKAVFCRSAFGVLRSRFCANTVSRWGDYTEYRQMVYRLYDMARMSSKQLWSHAEAQNVPKDEDSPLYLDEIAWLCNEMGFTSYAMGNMLDAMFVWQQGFEVNDLVDGAKDGVYRFQSHFNLGGAFIFLGKLYHARTYLIEALRIASEMKDESLLFRVQGHLALVKYLQGNLVDAHSDLTQVCKSLTANPRGLSVFLVYHGELLLQMGDIKEAELKIDQSRSLAEGSYYPDLVGYSRLAKANLRRQQKKYTEAQTEYSAAYDSAKEFHLRRLEAGVLSGQSRWAYELHDSEIACQKAVAALKIANEASLGLHQTLGLLNLGKALLLANQRQMGIAHLRSARLMAKDQGYFLRSSEAEAELRRMGEEVGSEADEL